MRRAEGLSRVYEIVNFLMTGKQEAAKVHGEVFIVT